MREKSRMSEPSLINGATIATSRRTTSAYRDRHSDSISKSSGSIGKPFPTGPLTLWRAYTIGPRDDTSRRRVTSFPSINSSETPNSP